jgi:hypothetical protein
MSEITPAERAKLVYWGCVYKPTAEAFMQSIAAAALEEAEQRGYVAGLKAATEVEHESPSTAPEAETEGPWQPRAVRWSEVSIDPPGRLDTKTRILNAKCAGKSYILESEIIRDLHRNPICHRSEVQEG